MFKWLRIIFLCIPRIIVLYCVLFYYKLKGKKLSRIRRYKYLYKNVLIFNKKLKVDLIVDGLDNIPPDSSFIFAPNHQSLWDPVTLVACNKEPIAFVAKKETKKMPVVGKVLTSLDGIFMDRENLRQEMEVMKKVKKSLTYDNLKWAIFPEGTRTKDENHKVGEFKAGTFKMSVATNTYIIPVAIYGTFRVLSSKIRLKKYPVHVSILKPIDKELYKTMKTTELSPMIQKMVSDRVEELKLLNQKYLENLKK